MKQIIFFVLLFLVVRVIFSEQGESSIVETDTYTSDTVTEQGCEFNGKIYNVPKNAYCADNNIYHAWMCHFGYEEYGNTCVRKKENIINYDVYREEDYNDSYADDREREHEEYYQDDRGDETYFQDVYDYNHP